MIGMSQIKKRLVYGIAIGLGVGVIGIALTAFFSIRTVKSYQEGTNKKFLSENTTELAVLNRDVIQGETIKADMISTQRVHIKVIPSGGITIGGSGAVVGQVAKYNIPANMPITSDMFSHEIVTVDERIQEVSTVALPTNLMEGDVMDIKLKLASGLEYLVLAQVKVQKISGTTIWLHLDEEELYLLNSATVDTYITDGAVLYGVQYVDTATQIKLDEKAADQARIDLAKRIEAEVARGTEVLPPPTTVEKSRLEDIQKDNSEVTITRDITDEDVNTTNVDDVKDNKVKREETKEYIDFSTKLSDLILKYAIEYRYYIEAYNKIRVTYQPSDIVRDHMIANKHITDQAKEKLSANLRRQLEEKLSQFENTSGDKFEEAVTGLQEQITVQQGLRSGILNAQNR
ncbi:MAG: SAF domain-containing protein [Clostridia bacterium]|nr:SAF domain-containing protein [Clostridia bacterium]MDD4375665.1 SAF domain-containing protein [Clostridia bacterium]